MARRNRVPESVSMETPKARKAEERRRRAITAEDLPSVSANTPAVRREKARVSEETRLSTGVRIPFTGIHVGAVPKARWDRMTWEERDASVRAAQQGMEDAAAYAMPGMIIRNPAHLGKGMVAKAESMLKGRSWSDLARAERLAIKRATGLEQIEGGLPGWAKESMTDPALKPRMLERAREWQAGDTTTGRRLGTYKDITEGGRDYMASLDEGQWTEIWMRKAREGEMGSFNPLEETMYLTERANLAGKAPTVVHEGEHVSQSFTQFVKDAKIPYGYRPTEIEARIAEHRASLSPEQRANSLLEESQNNWGEKWYHEELKEEQQKLLQQDAKGGDTRADTMGGKVQRGKLKRWEDYKDAKEAMAAEAEAVSFVNAGIIEPQPLSEGDLADSRRSAKWLADNPERKGLLKEGTLPHTGRPRFVSLHGFREADYREGEPYGFQGDRYSTAVAVDQEAFQKNPKAYEQSGQWAVIPTVFPDADGVTRLHTVRDSEVQYRKTGEHFGIFDSVENANRGSEWDHHKGNAEWAETHEDAKGGDTGPAEDESIPETGGEPVPQGGPRIVINPSTFRNEKDALCVAFNEAFRLVMEEMGFNPVAEPTEAQRKFFSDTAYRDDELQLRRTILARICTFDTSVKDPTDEQLDEAVEFLGDVLEAGAPQNDWERKAVERLRDVIAKVAEVNGSAPMRHNQN